MEIKKLLFAVGISSIVLLSGCSRDMIEHQFHVDSETNTEYVTETIDAQGLTQQFEEYLKLHGFDAKIGFLTHDPEDIKVSAHQATKDPLDDVSLSDVSQDRLMEWAENPDSRLCIYAECDRDTGLYGLLPVMMKQMNTFYQTLQSLGDEWEEGEGFKGKTDMYLLSSMVEENGKYYLETILTTRYSKII